MRLSVALCTYNGEKFIKEQLESILKQTIAIDEIIICDDGSTDNTIKVIEEIQSEYPNKILMFTNEINLGSNKNFEKAISICTGDYIFLSDQDDIWKKSKVEKMMNCFEENQSLEGVFSNADLINDEGNTFIKKNLWESVSFVEKSLKDTRDLFSIIKHKTNMVTGATLCFKKEIKDLILPIPDIKKYYHDEWIAIIIASRQKLSYLNEELISYRIHKGQQIGIRRKQKKDHSKKIIKFNNYILGYNTPKSFWDLKQLCKIYFRNYLKFKKVSETISKDFHLNFNEISKSNLELFKKNNSIMQKSYPILYFALKISDKIRGKRQIIS